MADEIEKQEERPIEVDEAPVETLNVDDLQAPAGGSWITDTMLSRVRSPKVSK